MRRGCCTKPRPAHWSRSKGGVENAASHRSPPARPARRWRCESPQRRSPQAQARFSQTALCNSHRRVRVSRCPQPTRPRLVQGASAVTQRWRACSCGHAIASCPSVVADAALCTGQRPLLEQCADGAGVAEVVCGDTRGRRAQGTVQSADLVVIGRPDACRPCRITLLPSRPERHVATMPSFMTRTVAVLLALSAGRPSPWA